MPKEIICPNCVTELELSDEESFRGVIVCPECDVQIEFASGEIKFKPADNFVKLLSSLNQGDIGIIKSMLDDAEIEYYVFGENFLAVRPLLEPVTFYVKESQFEEAKEVLKDFDLNNWGCSTNQY